MPHSIKPGAVDDLAHIHAEGTRLFGLGQADAYADSLYEMFDFLAEYPYAARLREQLEPPVRAYTYKSHVIVYDLGPDDTVLILRVRHYREDWVSAPLG